MNTTTLAEDIGLTKDEARALGKLACDAAEAGNLEDARQMLETLLLLNPRDATMSAALGTVYQKLEMPKEADAAYSAAIDLADHSFARVYRGELRLSSGDLRGEEDLRAVLSSDPLAKTMPGARSKMILDARARMKK